MPARSSGTFSREYDLVRAKTEEGDFSSVIYEEWLETAAVHISMMAHLDCLKIIFPR